MYCKCGGADSCCNRITKENMANDDEEHSDEDDADGEEDNEYL